MKDHWVSHCYEELLGLSLLGRITRSFTGVNSQCISLLWVIVSLRPQVRKLQSNSKRQMHLLLAPVFPIMTIFGVVGWGDGAGWLTVLGYPRTFCTCMMRACYVCSRNGKGSLFFVCFTTEIHISFILPYHTLSSSFLFIFSFIFSLVNEVKWPSRVVVSLHHNTITTT